MTEPIPSSATKGAVMRTTLRIAAVVVLAVAVHQPLNWASAEAQHEAGQLAPSMLAAFLLV